MAYTDRDMIKAMLEGDDWAFETATKTALEAEKSLGSTPDYVEAFNNGYRFERGFVTFVDMADEDGVNMGAYPEAIFDYMEQISIRQRKDIFFFHLTDNRLRRNRSLKRRGSCL